MSESNSQANKTQRTAKGTVMGVPKRSEFVKNLNKIVKTKKAQPPRH